MTACWVDGAAGSAYDVSNLPYGVFAAGQDDEPRVGVRIGDFVVDLAPLAASEMVDGGHVFSEPSLNGFMALGRAAWESVRGWLVQLLSDVTQRAAIEPFLVPISEVTLHLPFEVADYVDFYCSVDHASNVGRIFRPDAEPLLPNWRHLPVGYHGRAGTVVCSGTTVTRPVGQRRPADPGGEPGFGPSERLDLEAELGFVVGTPSGLGSRVPTTAFADHVFGVVLVNDWSARDIQSWEYVPLGPFLGKSFATSVSCWVTPLAALDGARCPLPPQQPTPLPYLAVDEPAGYEIDLQVEVNGVVVSRPPYASMYWSPAQMLAHLTVNGASLRTGDLFASGTVSGPEPDQRGSLLELSWGGAEPLQVGAATRTFLEDGDEVVLRASAAASGGRVALGEVRGRVAPALTPPDHR
ncbi:MAG TPA: fumarylacetoacetase [Nocardioidaceae bacterium]|nr:fumarylacetoacetase [Nocardioidaceae bacterium]